MKIWTTIDAYFETMSLDFYKSVYWDTKVVHHKKKNSPLG